MAAAVGLKRAALFYHFRDKQSLYEAVIADAFGSLATRLYEAFAAPGSIPERIERSVEVWVDTITARPTIARLILRHAAEAEDNAPRSIFPDSERLVRTALSAFEAGRASGQLRPLHNDFFHAASAVLGATVFYVAAMSALVPDADFNPLAPAQVAAHREDALRTVRLLLGMPSKDPADAP